MEALAGAENAGKHGQASSGFAAVPAEEKPQLRGDNLNR